MSFKKILMLGGAVAVMTSGAIVQQARATTDDITVDAVIVTPLAITCNTNLDFGSIDAGASGGNVVVDTTGTPTYGGTTVGIGAFPPSAGGCTTTGDAALAYKVTIPDAPNGVVSGGNDMDVIDFTINDGVNGELPADVGYSTALSGGAGTLAIGATLVVGAAQAPGTYTGNITVTAIYD